jgi:2',3'-cyclic-nucleotide 2'-phosphodiesterase/3'-nucleotidase
MRSFVFALGLAGTLMLAPLCSPPALAQAARPAQAAPKPAAKPAPKPAARPAARPANRTAARPAARPPAPPPVEAPLPEASGEQIAAASLTHFGPYDCEFGKKINVSLNSRHEGYVDVRLDAQTWVMRPVLSSTGALRLEDVRGRTLMLQIANKSMLMDTVAGRRLVDECVHEKQRLAMASAGAPLAAGLLSGDTPLRVRVLGLTDLHAHLVNHDYYQDQPTYEYGLALTATLVRQARAEQPNSVLLDNGDLLQGSPLGDWVAKKRPADQAGSQHPAHRLLQALGLDAATVGNHEFNFGLPFLGEAVRTAGFPYVSANVEVVDPDGRYQAGRPAYTPFVILERSFNDDAGRPAKLRIGVTGLVPPQVMQWDRQHLEGRIRVLDMVAAARQVVPQMRRDGADVVVLLAHSGLGREDAPPMSENVVAQLATIPGVDAIVFGHSHAEFPGPAFASQPKVDIARGTIHNVPAVMAGRWGSHLGVIDLVLRQEGGRWKVVQGKGEIRPVFDRVTRRPFVAADAEMLRLAQAEHEATLAYMRSPVASTATPLHSYFAQVMDDASVQLVSQAQLAYAQRALAGTPHAGLPLLSAAAPFKTGGRQGWSAYTDIPAGPLAVRNVADLYVFPNTLQVVKVSGAQVREWLEFAACAFNRIDPQGAAEQPLLNPSFPSFNFDTLDGLSYRIDLTQPARYERGGQLVAPQARRIRELQFQGQPVTDEMQFAVVTNNYRAGGGGSFPGLDGSNIILQAPDETREILLQHLQAQGTVRAAADGNWRLLPVPGIQLVFNTGLGAKPHGAALPKDGAQVRWLRDNGDGSATFELLP